MLLEERWHLIELVEATPVPLNEDVRDPSCKQAPVTNEPLPATMLSALEASLRHADENDEEGVQTAVFAANAAAIPASLKSTPTCTHTHTHFLSPFFFSKRDFPTTKGAPNTFEKNGRVKKASNRNKIVHDEPQQPSLLNHEKGNKKEILVK
jgi:hypothetical protein